MGRTGMWQPGVMFPLQLVAKHPKGRSSCLLMISLVDPAEGCVHDSNEFIPLVRGYKESLIVQRYACKLTQWNLSSIQQTCLSYMINTPPWCRDWRHFHLQSSLPSKTRQQSSGKYICLFSGLENNVRSLYWEPMSSSGSGNYLGKISWFIDSKYQKM